MSHFLSLNNGEKTIPVKGAFLDNKLSKSNLEKTLLRFRIMKYNRN